MINTTDFYDTFKDFVTIPTEPIEKVRVNPYTVHDLLDSQKDVRLFLTNIRTFQQYASPEEIAKSKLALSLARARKRGQPFKVKDKPPRFCRSYRIAFVNFSKGQLKDIQFTSVACKSWTCPACNAVKAMSVKYKLREVIIKNNLLYFLTLTLDPSLIPEKYTSARQNHTHKYITKLFNHFITVLKRKSFQYFNKSKNTWETYSNTNEKEKLKYVWVMEFQKNGNAHLHILLNQYLPIDIVREIWTHVGGGHIMKVENVKSLNGISYYLTDYIVKGIKHDSTEQSGFKYFERRYSISKSCDRTRLVYGNIDDSPEIKRHLRDRRLDWVTDYLYNPTYTDLTIKFTDFTNE